MNFVCSFCPSTAVFAPTDDAFAAVEGLGDIIADKEALTALLQNHVVVGKALASDLSDGQQITAAGGETLNVKVSDSGLMINNANVISADVDASNGVIHVIDAVLSFTTPTPNIVEVAKAAGSFTTLLSAVQEAGLVDFLSGEGPFSEYTTANIISTMNVFIWILIFSVELCLFFLSFYSCICTHR